MLLFLLFVLGGTMALQVPVERPGAYTGAAMRVTAELPGFDAAAVETTVTRQLEQAFAALPGLRRLESRTRQGVAHITLQFDSPARRDAAEAEARRRLLQSYPQLPAGMDVPVLARLDRAEPPAVVYAIDAPPASAETVRWVKDIFLDPLRELPQVVAVTFDGFERREIVIEPDDRRLAGLGLSFDDLVRALREDTRVPPRRRRPGRGIVTVPAGAEAVAARAVQLPSGEPVALAEIARVLVAPAPPARAGADGASGLRAAVYVRSVSQAPYVAERAAGHLAWLRANDIVPPGVAIRAVHDEAQAARRWRRQAAGRLAAAAAILCALIFAAFGRRGFAAVAIGFVVWLPAAVGGLRVFELPLNAATAAALVLATVPFALAALMPMSAGGIAAVALAAVVFGSLAFALGGAAGAGAFAGALFLGAGVRWLTSAWARPDAAALRAGVPRWPFARAPKAGTVVLLLVACAATVAVAFPLTRSGGDAGTWRLQLRGEDPARLAAAAAAVLPAAHAIGHVGDVASSMQAEESWRLHLDPERLDRHALAPAEVGRAFAVATGGLQVGEVVSAEHVLPIRLRLPPGVAGAGFERLLLRGERDRQRAVYLRDVGLVERIEEPRQRLRLDGVPAVEVTARWRGASARAALERLCGVFEAPPGSAFACVFEPAPF